MKRVVLILIFSVVTGTLSQLSAQESVYPEVGELCPDFSINNLEYFPKKQVKPSDFKGKWLILDFYDKNCGNCMAAFPGYSNNQLTYGDKLQIILVGREDKENKIRSIYSKLRRQQHLQLPCAFDSSLFIRLDINSSPYAIIIDPMGVVQYITLYFTDMDLSDILSGNRPILRTNYREHQKRPDKLSYDYATPFLVNGNGGSDTDFLYRSLLTKFNPSKQPSVRPPGTIESNSKRILQYHTHSFDALGIGIGSLYRYAYFDRPETGHFSFNDSLYGKVWPKNIIETKDSSIFQFSTIDGRNMYCYSLTVPPSRYSKEYMMQIMQNDLKNYFGYEVVVEKRKMPCWKLIASQKAKMNLVTNGERAFATSGDHEYRDSVVIKNMPVSFLISRVLPTNRTTMPFVDETGITSNIDITLKYFGQPELNTLIDALREKGLDLIRGEKEMKVLVIKDLLK